MHTEQAAIHAWRQLGSGRGEPDRLQVLRTENQATTICRLSWAGEADSPIVAKRCRQDTARIERTIYEEIAPKLPLPMLHYYGFVEEPATEFSWLFVEDVSADERYNPNLKEHRVAAAHWLGIMNTSASALAATPWLPERGPAHYLNLLQTAHDTVLSNMGNPSLTDDDHAWLARVLDLCDHLVENWSQLAYPCEEMPQTLVHGDFIKKNVAVRRSQDGTILLPFDWEKAGWGIAAEDISRVDIDAYWSTVRDHWPGLGAKSLGRLASVGKVFRCLVFLDWIAPKLAHEAVGQPMNDVRRCEGWLVDLIRAAAWRD
jgi:hypothetical protein